MNTSTFQSFSTQIINRWLLVKTLFKDFKKAARTSVRALTSKPENGKTEISRSSQSVDEETETRQPMHDDATANDRQSSQPTGARDRYGMAN